VTLAFRPAAIEGKINMADKYLNMFSKGHFICSSKDLIKMGQKKILYMWLICLLPEWLIAAYCIDMFSVFKAHGF